MDPLAGSAYLLENGSKILIGPQVRFLSKFFLKKGESLYHGIDLFKEYLNDDKLVEEIAAARQEQHLYTFQAVLDAVSDRFPDQFDGIMRGIVEMLTFDALVGNNDRHPANWGVITPMMSAKAPRFSPVFDTARALFWNVDERRIRDTLSNEQQLLGYINRSRPQIGWDHADRIGHFDLIQRVFDRYEDFRPSITKFFETDVVRRMSPMVKREFSRLLSDQRRRLILECLERRHDLLRKESRSLDRKDQ